MKCDMKKSFLCSLCFCLTGMLLFSSCDLITTKKEKEQMMLEAQMQRETDRKIAYDRKKNDRDRAWLDQHQDIADKLVIDFVNNKGYSMQAFRVVKRSASDGSFVVSYDSKLPSTIQTATYDYDVVTSDTASDGSLIYIHVRVLYKKSAGNNNYRKRDPEWIITLFQPYKPYVR